MTTSPHGSSTLKHRCRAARTPSPEPLSHEFYGAQDLEVVVGFERDRARRGMLRARIPGGAISIDRRRVLDLEGEVLRQGDPAGGAIALQRTGDPGADLLHREARRDAQGGGAD